MIFHDKPGYLDKDDIIKSMANDIERLQNELRESRYMKTKYRDDIQKVFDDNIRLRNELHRFAQMVYGPFATWHDPKGGQP